MKLFVLIFFAASALAQTPYVPATKLLKKKGYQLGFTFDSWTTSKRVDDKGKKEAFEDGESFSRYQGEVAGYYGATSDLQFGFGVRYRQNRSSFTEGANEYDATGSGVESTFASIKFAFPLVDRLQYTLEGEFRFRPYSNQEFDSANPDYETLALGDEGNQISAGVGVTYSNPDKIFFTVRGGYRKAGSDLSDELFYNLELAKAFQKVAILAGAEGVSSMKNDPYGNDQTQRPVFVYGRTRLYNQENREYIAPYLGANLAMGKDWRLEFKGSQTITGKSTDLGTALAISLIRRTDSSETRLLDSKFKTYDIEASVTKVSPQQNYVVIDKGIADDIQKGMKFDFFEFDYVGGNVLVASGVVLQTKSDSAVVKITQRFNSRKELKNGLIGRSNLK